MWLEQSEVGAGEGPEPDNGEDKHGEMGSHLPISSVYVGFSYSVCSRTGWRLDQGERGHVSMGRGGGIWSQCGGGKKPGGSRVMDSI